MAQHHRRSADGADELLLFGMAHESRAHALMLVEVLSAGHSAGQHEQVGVAEVGIGEHHVRLHLHAVCRRHHVRSVDANCLYVESAAAEDIYWCQRLYVLEAVGKKYVCFCHVVYVYLLLFCILHFRTQHAERIGCLCIVLILLLLNRIVPCIFKYDISKYVFTKIHLLWL